MLYELRRYRVAAGHMPQMHDRMERQLLPMFARYGVPTPLGVWECTAGPSAPQLVWMVAWTDYETMQTTWASLYPEWQKIRASSVQDREFVLRTGISLLSAWPGSPAADHSLMGSGIDELWVQRIAVAKSGEMRASFLSVDRPALEACGAKFVGGFDHLIGEELPQSALLLSWPDAETRARGLKDYDASETVLRRREQDWQSTGLPAEAPDRLMLAPASYLRASRP